MVYAVNHIHESGICLRDINLGNIMLCDKQMKFSDLGMAKILINDYKPTSLWAGTPQYMPPWYYVVRQMDNLLEQDEALEKLDKIDPDWKIGNIF